MYLVVRKNNKPIDEIFIFNFDADEIEELKKEIRDKNGDVEISISSDMILEMSNQ